MNAVLWSSLRGGLSIFSKTLLVFLFVAVFSPGEAILDAKAFLFLLCFYWKKRRKTGWLRKRNTGQKIASLEMKGKHDFKDRLAGSSRNGAGVDPYYVVSCF